MPSLIFSRTSRYISNLDLFLLIILTFLKSVKNEYYMSILAFFIYIMDEKTIIKITGNIAFMSTYHPFKDDMSYILKEIRYALEFKFSPN